MRAHVASSVFEGTTAESLGIEHGYAIYYQGKLWFAGREETPFPRDVEI